MLIVFFMTMALCHAGNLNRHERAVRVDRIELNAYEWADGCIAQQVILWQWCPFEQKLTATRYFLLGDDNAHSLPFRVSGRKWRFAQRNPFNPTKTVIFESADYVVTETDYDVWHEAMFIQRKIAI